MSHYRVGVLLNDKQSVDEIMHPYDEGTDDEDLLKYEIDCDKFSFLENYVYDHIFTTINMIIEKSSFLCNLSNDEINFTLDLLNYNEEDKIKLFAKHNGYELDDDLNKLNRYNPNAKYDYYSDYGTHSWFELSEKVPYDFVNSSFDNYEAVYLKNIPKKKWLMNMPYAMVTAEEWISPGDVGWFACDSSTDETRENYEKIYTNILKDEKYKDYKVVILDLHI